MLDDLPEKEAEVVRLYHLKYMNYRQIAKKLGINDVHYSMVIVCAMNVGLMMPPIGVGFYVACRIGGARPDDVMGAIWPYLAALLAGVAVIAAVPWLSTVAL